MRGEGDMEDEGGEGDERDEEDEGDEEDERDEEEEWWSCQRSFNLLLGQHYITVTRPPNKKTKVDVG